MQIIYNDMVKNSLTILFVIVTSLSQTVARKKRDKPSMTFTDCGK